tara:strand:+ start:1624 stop:1911 length:288 start_codon:yes stop_codon:yes gene_type:complete
MGMAAPQASRVAFAEDQTVESSVIEKTTTFAVEGMYCALCPVTVRKAMEGVTGVKSVAVDFEAKTAAVTFDPSLATPEQIAEASSMAGYPAAPTL